MPSCLQRLTQKHDLTLCVCVCVCVSAFVLWQTGFEPQCSPVPALSFCDPTIELASNPLLCSAVQSIVGCDLVCTRQQLLLVVVGKQSKLFWVSVARERVGGREWELSKWEIVREREREIDLEEYEDAELNCYLSVDQYNGDRRRVCNRRNVSFFLSSK